MWISGKYSVWCQGRLHQDTGNNENRQENLITKSKWSVRSRQKTTMEVCKHFENCKCPYRKNCFNLIVWTLYHMLTCKLYPHVFLVSYWFSCCCDQTLVSNNWKGRYFSLQLQSLIKGIQGSNNLAGTETEAKKEQCLLAASHSMLCLLP